MPLSFAKPGDIVTIQKIGGREAVRQHLVDLGFVEGDKITVVTSLNGNLIVQVKQSRIALDKKMADRILFH